MTEVQNALRQGLSKRTTPPAILSPGGCCVPTLRPVVLTMASVGHVDSPLASGDGFQIASLSFFKVD